MLIASQLMKSVMIIKILLRMPGVPRLEGFIEQNKVSRHRLNLILFDDHHEISSCQNIVERAADCIIMMIFSVLRYLTIRKIQSVCIVRSI